MIPFLFGAGTAALGIAVALSAVTLFVVGAAIAMLTGRNPIRGGLRMVVIAGLVGLASNMVGRLIGQGVSV